MPLTLFQMIHASTSRHGGRMLPVSAAASHLVAGMYLVPLTAGKSLPLCADGFPALAITLHLPTTIFIIHEQKSYPVDDAWCCSPLLQAATLDVSGEDGQLLVIRFYPSAFAQLSRKTMQEMRQTPVWRPEEIWGDDITVVLNELKTLPSVPAKCIRLEQWAMAQNVIPPNPLVDDMMWQVITGDDIPEVKSFTGTLGRSYKWLERNFNRYTGLAPKEFICQQRFVKACVSLSLTASPDYLALAVNHGYCDQQHLSREFRRFAGISPRVFHQKIVEIFRKL